MITQELREIQTPAALLDLDIMEHNLRKYQDLADQYHKQIWPMTKTHKSTRLMELQMKYGARGVLCGTLDECEAAVKLGIPNVMYAYPAATERSMEKVCGLAAACVRFIIRLDDLEGAALIERIAERRNVRIFYTIILDSGLHRFGIPPRALPEFYGEMSKFSHLTFLGLSSHPGHVYASTCEEDLLMYAKDENRTMQEGVDALETMGIIPEIVSSGSTPTFRYNIDSTQIGIFHPGNYIFNDNLQISTNTASEGECALRILASVISHHGNSFFMCDAGAKALGIDQGAHGNHSIRGFGRVIGHPEVTVEALSEEVGKLHISGSTTLRTGDMIEIIPNHSCSAANLTSCYTGVRKGRIQELIPVDLRDNSHVETAETGQEKAMR